MRERFGQYELLKLIATGGMAEIYLAERSGEEGFSRRLVVKKMLPQLAVRKDFVSMFLDEAKLAANLVHPNIVQVFNLGEADGAYFMAMELVDGPHLGGLFAHSLRQRRPLPIELCVYCVARAADGLHYAHEQNDPVTGTPLNLVHRDISPQNILVSRHGDVKVTDFGVAKAENQSMKTRTGIIKGKVSYMSPEQCLGDRVDRQTDVFALGIVLYELLTRRRLYREKSDLLVMQRITTEDVPPPSTLNKKVNDGLDAIALKALSRDQSKRHMSAELLAKALDVWLRENGFTDCRAQLERWMKKHGENLRIGPAPEESVSQPRWQAVGHSDEATTTTSPEEDQTIATPALGNDSSDSLDNSTLVVSPEDLLRVRPNIAEPRVDATVPDGPPPPVMTDEDDGRTLIAPPPVGLTDSVTSGASPADPPVLDVEEDLLSETSRPELAPVEESPQLPMAAIIGAACLFGVLLVGYFVLSAVFADDDPPVVDAGPIAAIKKVDAGTKKADPTKVVEDPNPVVKPVNTTEVRVVTIPPGATVLLGTEALGASPVTYRKAKPGDKLEFTAVFPKQIPVKGRVVVKEGPMTVKLLAKVPLTVRSKPSGAIVSVGGEAVGTTPKSGLLVDPSKPVVIELKAAGYQDLKRTVRATPGKALVIDETLKPSRVQRKTYGRIQVNSRPWGNVIVDGSRVGVTPRSLRARTGRHTVKVFNNSEGFAFSKTVTINVKKDQTTTLNFVWMRKNNKWHLKDYKVK